MKTQRSERMLVATDEGLHVWDAGQMARADSLAGRQVTALARGEDDWWAAVEGREVWRAAVSPVAQLRWERVAVVPGEPATCLAATAGGLLVGTVGAHLLRLEGGSLAPIAAFDEADGRRDWYTPWGAPADVRSMAVGVDGAVYVNVHVGGVLRTLDAGASWRPMLDIEHDVHQVLASPERPGVVFVAAYDGFGASEDGGTTWRWDNAGLHAHYCRAVAVDGDTLLLSASAGHHGRRAAVYRRRLDGRAGFERCREGLPEWFADNVDTGCLAVRGSAAAIGSEDGRLFLSRDGGARWDEVAKDLGAARAVSFDR